MGKRTTSRRRKKKIVGNKVRHPAERLDELLTLIEHQLEFIRLIDKCKQTFSGLESFKPIIDHFGSLGMTDWSNLREEMLAPTLNLDAIYQAPLAVSQTSVVLQQLLHAIALWVRESKRVYHLTGQMTAEMSNIDATSIIPEELPLPFPSVLITFEDLHTTEVTFQHKFSNLRWDALFLSRIKSSPKYLPQKYEILLVTLIGPDMHRTTTSMPEIMQLKRALSSRNRVAALNSIRRANKKILSGEGFNCLSRRYKVGARNTAQLTSKSFSQAYGLFLTNLVKTVCERLTQCEPHFREGLTGTRKNIKFPKQAMLASQAEIFSVPWTDLLRPARVRRNSPASAGSSMNTPHARCGHWRRPPGTAPNHPKTVWVNSTVVRKDLIPEGHTFDGKELVVEPET